MSSDREMRRESRSPSRRGRRTDGSGYRTKKRSSSGERTLKRFVSKSHKESMMAAKLFSHIEDPAARVRALCDYGSQVEVDETIPVKLYFRSGREIIRMANVYLDEKNYESAFILYSKYVTLFVERLPKHPDYKKAPVTEANEVKKKLKSVFSLAEELKTKLKTRYTQELKKKQEEGRKAAEAAAKLAAVKAAEEEAARQAQAAEDARQRRESEELWLRQQEERYRELQEQEQAKLNRQKTLEKTQEPAGIPSVPPPEYSQVFPESSGGSSLNNERTAAPSGTLDFVPNDLSGPIPAARAAPPVIPDRELKKNLVINDAGAMPAVDRSSKPRIDHFTSAGEFGGTGGLRQVQVPDDLMRKFLGIAAPNTSRDVETLGILFGSMAHNSFTVTHLFVPHQSGTPDSCDMENEEDLILFQDQYNLIQLGWIHTHPTQTAFLSSVDLHSHFPYQKMLPEAIAVVCAPKYQETGIFRLTTEKGLEEIGRCTQKGFHYHPKEPPLFENCGHVQVVSGGSVQIADYRKK